MGHARWRRSCVVLRNSDFGGGAWDIDETVHGSLGDQKLNCHPVVQAHKDSLDRGLGSRNRRD